MRVNHRRRDVGMAEQILHGSNVVTAAEQGRRERV
ncbi:integron integrase domain protein, partial [Acinetobacter baumannii 929679-598]